MAQPRSLSRKVLVALAAIVGGIAVLLVALVLVLQSGVATKRAVDLVLPKVSQALGREVTLQAADLKLLPHARVRLGGLTVAGRQGEPALVQAESLDVEVGLWPLLRSLGKDVEVRAFTLVRPTVNLVRAKDGTWNYEGLGQPSGAPGAKEGTAAPPSEPPPAEPKGGGARVAVDHVRIENAAFQLVDHSGGKQDQGLAVKDLDLDARGVGPGLPFDAKLDAAIADEKQNLHAQLSVAKLPAAVPQAAADWPVVTGTVKLSALALDRIRSLFPGEFGSIVRGGTASLDARLSTADGPAYRVEGGGGLSDVRLRGQPASGQFKTLATWSPAKPDAARVEVTNLAVKGPGVDLGGTATVETAPMRATFALSGPLLDLDAVMGVLPDAPAQQQQEKAPPPDAGGAVVPEATRKQIQAAAARGTISVDKLRGGHLEATNVKARAVLSGGTLKLDQMDAAVFGGQVSATGTEVSLAEKEPKWKLAAKLSDLDLGKAIAAFSGRSPIVAKLNGDLRVDGAGTDWQKIKQAVTGLAALLLQDGTLTTTSLGDEVLGAVSKGLAAAGKGGFAKRVGGLQGGKTSIKDLSGKFTVKDGFLAASSPFKFKSDVGDIALGGRIGLDGRLDLTGTVSVPKAVLAQAVSGLPLPEKLDVPLSLGGTLEAPTVGVKPDDAARALLRGQTQAAEKAVRGEAERAARKGLGGLLDRFGEKKK
ncbi:MAG TPA: AsmA family protein [Anaeromyxobacter sp.]|nr:AsmA family protein [Anaeromyxobacter sp.]